MSTAPSRLSWRLALADSRADWKYTRSQTGVNLKSARTRLPPPAPPTGDARPIATGGADRHGGGILRHYFALQLPSEETAASMRNELKRVFKDSTIYGLGSMIPRFAAIVLTPIYTVYLTRSDYGVMSFAMMFSSMLGTVMTLGQNGSLILFYRKSAEYSEERREMLFTVFWFVMLFGALILGLGFLLGPSTARILTGSSQVPFNPYLALAFLISFLTLPQALQQSINRALGQAKLFTAFQVASFAVNTGFTLYFVVALHQGAYGSMKGTLVAAAVIFPASMVVIIRRWRPRLSRRGLLRSLRFGLPLVPHYFAAWALTYLDRYLLLRLSTAAQVGLYSLAYNFSMVLNLFCSAINTAWTPVYYDLADTHSDNRTLARMTTAFAAAVTVLAIGFTLLAPDAMILLSSRSFHAAAPVVPVVSGGYFFFALYMVVSTPIFHARKTGWAPAISASAAALNAGINLILIPRYGMMGAAWATLIAYGFMAGTAYYIANRLRSGVFEHGKLAALVGVYSVALALGIAFVAIGLNLWLDIAIKIAILPLFFALLLVSRVTTIAELRAVLRRSGKRGQGPPKLDDEVSALEREQEEIGSSSDSTGVLPDNRR